MQRKTTEEENGQQVNKTGYAYKFHQLFTDVGAGLFSGAFCAGLFNPWDRALFLSVSNFRPFLRWENFYKPYHGASQAVFQRAFLGGTYFIIQSQLKSNLRPYLLENGASEFSTQFCIGLLSGCMSGIFTNSISAIKYHTWGDAKRTFFSSAHEMWSQGGIKPFIKGTKATVLRDTTFGCTYEVLRYLMQSKLKQYDYDENNQYKFYCNFMATIVAAIASSPFNYARTIQYATPPHEKPLFITQILHSVWNQSKAMPTIMERMGFFQNQFRIGWGTARVGAGMAVGQAVFDGIKSRLS